MTLKPADFSAQCLVVRFIFSDASGYFPPSEQGFKNTRNWARINKWPFFQLEDAASPLPAEPGSSQKGRKGKTSFSPLFRFVP